MINKLLKFKEQYVNIHYATKYKNFTTNNLGGIRYEKIRKVIRQVNRRQAAK